MNNQPSIPGLEAPTKPARGVKRKTLRDEVKELRGRVLRLELEVALLIIQLEKGEE
jgi:hypothetical protein